jgi:cytochrome P450
VFRFGGQEPAGARVVGGEGGAQSGDAHVDDEDPLDPLTMEELQGLMSQLVAGGFETTTSALGTGMWLLLRYPDQMAKLRADRSLVPNFVEESLRFDSPVTGLWRTTTCPVTVAGTEIPEGASVMPRYAAANRDPAVFDRPDVFDIERANANRHLAFGMGPHYCVGAALARAELTSAFTACLDRLDDIELAEPLDEQPHDFSFFLRRLKRLPLTFTKV